MSELAPELEGANCPVRNVQYPAQVRLGDAACALLAMQPAHDLAAERAAGLPTARGLVPVLRPNRYCTQDARRRDQLGDSKRMCL